MGQTPHSDSHENKKREAAQSALADGGAPSLLDSSNTYGENKPRLVHWKLIKTGDHEDYYHYEKSVLLSGKSRTQKPNVAPPKLSKKEKQERREKMQRISLARTRNTVRRLVDANFNGHDKFLTLTFRDTDDFDIKSVADCNAEFRKFIKRMKYRFGNFKYLAAIEFQDKNDRGAVHYHIVYKLPFIPIEQIEQIWGLGFIWIRDITGVDSIGGYLTKYLSKNHKDERLFNQKCYFTSKGLKRPIVIYGRKAILGIKWHSEAGHKPVYRSIFKSEYNGKVDYYQFDLNRLEGKSDS